MDRIRKLLRTLTAKEEQLLKALLLQIAERNMKGYDVKKIKGQSHVYRVRQGDFRVIYEDDGVHISILSVGRRSNNTYRDY